MREPAMLQLSGISIAITCASVMPCEGKLQPVNDLIRLGVNVWPAPAVRCQCEIPGKVRIKAAESRFRTMLCCDKHNIEYRHVSTVSLQHWLDTRFDYVLKCRSDTEFFLPKSRLTGVECTGHVVAKLYRRHRSFASSAQELVYLNMSFCSRCTFDPLSTSLMDTENHQYLQEFMCIRCEQ